MEFIFTKQSGSTLFTRSDMLSGRWVQHEMNLTAEFPFDTDKNLQTGIRMAFRNPDTDKFEIFEIRQVINSEPTHTQRITADHIAVAELSDEHINKTEIDNKTAAQALATALTGTLWSVGTNTASGTQSADFARGSVWQAVSTIKQNWNVYITPRVVVGADGQIQNRYLDIAPAGGTFNGIRLSIRKNLLDPTVTYNDENVYTALYGYGATKDDNDLTFADVVWAAEDGHPAKPRGQTYLEYPARTGDYGRNGRPRFGFYQNANITDANVLLQKTWEALKNTCEPKISINGTVAELKRLGYVDEPLRLHDIAIVEIAETGERFDKEIITIETDLCNPLNTRVGIGDYIPNIIYINRDTAGHASGGGGGGGVGQTPNEAEQSKTFAEFAKTNDMIGMVVGTRNGGYYVKAAEIVLSINQDGGTNIKLQADTIDIDGVINSLTAKEIYVGGLGCANNIVAQGHVVGNEVWASTKIKVGTYDATWQSQSVITNISLTGSFSVVDTNGVTHTIKAVSTSSSTTSKTMHFLGR